MKRPFLRLGVQWLLVVLLLASRSAGFVYAQSPNDATFLATLGELRDATFADKEKIVERLVQSGHPNARVVLTAFLEDRLYFRSEDQKIFLLKSADESSPTVDLIDPVSLQDAGSASIDSLTKIGTNNRLRRILQTTLGPFRVVEQGPSSPLGRSAGDRARLGRSQCGTTPRAERR